MRLWETRSDRTNEKFNEKVYESGGWDKLYETRHWKDETQEIGVNSHGRVRGQNQEIDHKQDLEAGHHSKLIEN